jgi:hypothetical protein
MTIGLLVQLLIHSILKDMEDKQEEMKIPHIMVTVLLFSWCNDCRTFDYKLMIL